MNGRSGIVSRRGVKGATVDTLILHVDAVGPDKAREAQLKGPVTAENGLETRTYSLSVKCSNGRELHRSEIIQSPEIVLPDNPTLAQIEAYNDAVEKQNLSDGQWLLGALRDLRLECGTYRVPGDTTPVDRPHEKFDFDCSKAPQCWCGQKHCYQGH